MSRRTVRRVLSGVWTGARHGQFLVKQALTAIHFLRRDYHYLVRDDKVEILDELPKTSTGKIQKFVLREKEWAGFDSRVHGGTSN